MNHNLVTLVLSASVSEDVALVLQICKDKVEAEVWIAGLKALISGQGGRAKIDGWSDGLSIAVSK